MKKLLVIILLALVTYGQTQNLVLHLPLQDTITDISGYGNNGTGKSVTYVQAVRGKGVSFNGSSTRIQLPASSSLNLTGGMSIMVWVNSTSVALNTSKAIIQDYNSGGSLSQFQLWLNILNAGKVTFANRDGAGCYVQTLTSLTANYWYLIGVSRSGSLGNWTMKAYINGALNNTTTSCNADPQAQQGAAIGRSGNFNGNYFSGIMDEPMIYDGALPDTRFQTIYGFSTGKSFY